MVLDISDIQAIVSRCFAWSSDGTLSEDQRQSFFNLGMHLRDDMMNAYAKRFPDNDSRLAQLTNQLSSINKDIQAESDVANHYVAAVNNVTKCLGVLDSILAIATV